MRFSEHWPWFGSAALPALIGHESTLRRLPGWLTRLFGSARHATWGKRGSSTPLKAVDDEGDEAADLADFSGLTSSGGDRSLVDEMVAQSRYALLLRPQLIGNLSAEQLARTRAALSTFMCLVPSGEVSLLRVTAEAAEDEASSNLPLEVESFYLDRFLVSNLQFHGFVANGGYEQMAIWDREIWPAVLDFVDQTGRPGPRFWRNGRFPRGEQNHPVVGVCWYEAAAYARWAGKRLATGPEWVKAGSWPVALPGHPLLQRRYPWGEAMDRARANVWGSGPARTVSVDQFPGGVSVGGVQQLIGNVWEWTSDRFVVTDAEEPASSANLRVIRGGAFDTYLDCQATCHFQSADHALARKHNIGFRAAIGLCDLAKRQTPDDADTHAAGEAEAASENEIEPVHAEAT